MHLKPLGNNVLVKPLAPETKTPGGIFIPDNAQERSQHGIVEAVGRGRITSHGRLVEIEVKPGQRVLFSKYAAKEAPNAPEAASTRKLGEELVVLDADDILAVFEEG